ncbi:hypothetical protein JL720_1000 [Aureococcus anophagefferens]|nr:hypothetical protein JL720_1000 [Aureococcus anophagefferens]
MKKKARRRLERKQTVLQARRDPTARRNVADAARAKGSIRRKTAAMAAPAYPSAAPLNAKARAERSPNSLDNVAALVGAIPADLVAARRAARRHEKRGFSRWTLLAVLQKFGPAMLKMHRLLPSGDTVTSAEVVAAAAGVHAHYLEAKDTVYRSWTYLYFPVTRACFAPRPSASTRPRASATAMAPRVRGARRRRREEQPARDPDARARGRRARPELLRARSSVWLGCRESLKAADDDYAHVLEWLIRALGYALEVPDSCFDGLWDILTAPRLWPGLRYRDAYDACTAAGLPVALISVIVCEARLPASARRAFAARKRPL